MIVPATDDECNPEEPAKEEEREEGKLMTPTPRQRRHYQTGWQLLKKMSKNRFQESEINRQVAQIMDRLLKDAGYPAEHVSKTKDTDCSYWKEAQALQVSFYIFILLLLLLISLLFRQIYRGRKDSKKKHIMHWCPLVYLCSCKVQFKPCFTRDNVELSSSGAHDGMSHVQDNSKYLTIAQKAPLKLSTKSARNETGRAHVLNFIPDKRTLQDPSSIRNAQRVAVKQRRDIALSNTLGVMLDETNGAMTLLCEKNDFEKLNDLVCIRQFAWGQWNQGNTSIEPSMVHLILNVGRAIGSGWQLQIQAVGSFARCASDIGVIILGVDSLRGNLRYVSWPIVLILPNESSEAFSYCFNGIRAEFFKLLFLGEVRLCPDSRVLTVDT
jgi:hypothetical protein